MCSISYGSVWFGDSESGTDITYALTACVARFNKRTV